MRRNHNSNSDSIGATIVAILALIALPSLLQIPSGGWHMPQLPSSPPASTSTTTSPTTPTQQTQTQTDNTSQADTSKLATTILNTLPVQPQGNNYKQNRDRPKQWEPTGNGSATTRDSILKRDMTAVTLNSRQQVQAGTLNDPYTGKTITFQRTNAHTGTGDSTAVQIDHVVAFGEAWESGLSSKGTDTVNQYYNDPYVLLAVDGKANIEKSDADAAHWLPSNAGNPSYDCYYVARQIGVKSKYGLSVDTMEKQAMQHVLASCPTITVPDSDGATWQTTSTNSQTVANKTASPALPFVSDLLNGLKTTVSGTQTQATADTAQTPKLTTQQLNTTATAAITLTTITTLITAAGAITTSILKKGQ